MLTLNLAPKHKIRYTRVPSGIPMIEVDGEKLPAYTIKMPVTLGQAIWYDRRSH